MAQIPAYAPIQPHNESDTTRLTTAQLQLQSKPVSATKCYLARDRVAACIFLGLFLTCAIWSTVYIWLSRRLVNGDVAPVLLYLYILDWGASTAAYAVCLVIICESAGANDWTLLMIFSVLAQVVTFGTHLLTLIIYIGRYTDTPCPNTITLWKAWSSWLNVLMAVVMVLRNRDVSWAEELYTSVTGVEGKNVAGSPAGPEVDDTV